MAAFSQFYITDGTTKVNLIQANTEGIGIGVSRVRFQRPKRDTESIFSLRYKPVDETYSIVVSGTNQDDAIYRLRQLEGLLVQAENFFSNSMELGLVWLCSQASKEANPRYAIVLAGAISEYADIYQQPFVNELDASILDDMDLGITRSAWLANPPASPKQISVKTSSIQTGVAYIDNRFTESMILSVKVFDASAGTYVTYPLGAVVYPAGSGLLPPVPAVGDITYFGFNPESAGTVALPSAIYFELVTPEHGIATVANEYWNGAAWTAIPFPRDNWSAVIDGTFAWATPTMDNWAANAVDGITANWIRRRVTGLSAGPSPAIVNHIYTPRNYIEIANLSGELPVLADVLLENRGFIGGVNKEAQQVTSTVYMGLRTVDRGPTFQPWLYPQAPAVLPVSGTRSTVNGYDFISTGQLVRATPANFYEDYASYKTYGRVIDGVTQVTTDYYGTFRAYVRVLYKGATNHLSFRIAELEDSLSATFIYYGPEVFPVAAPTYNVPVLYDLGQVSIGFRDYAKRSEQGGSYRFYLQCKCDPVGESIDIFDLILMPIDEWSGSFVDPNMQVFGIQNARIGSASFHKRNIRAVALNGTTIFKNLISNASGPLVFQPGKTQRLYFLTETYNGAYLGCKYDQSNKLTISIHERFTGMRGNG